MVRISWCRAEKGRRGGGGERDEVFENVWEVPSPSPELVSSILRTICFFFFLTFVVVIVVLFYFVYYNFSIFS